MDLDSCMHRLREPPFREMISDLRLPEGSRGLDAGCGVGLQCRLLAEAVGTSGHVTGLDISPDAIDRGRKLLKENGLSERISLKEGDISHIPFDDDTFDWSWSADCVGYAPLDPRPFLKEMSRVVKPGGIVAIAAWSSETLLPGYPRLEARLKATSDGIAPFSHGKPPERHFLRALGWFRDMDLENPTARAFAGSVSAPLEDEIRDALKELFDMRWPDVASELSADDLAEFQRLCLPDSPDFIVNRPDYHGFFTYTMVWGKIPEM